MCQKARAEECVTESSPLFTQPNCILPAIIANDTNKFHWYKKPCIPIPATMTLLSADREKTSYGIQLPVTMNATWRTHVWFILLERSLAVVGLCRCNIQHLVTWKEVFCSVARPSGHSGRWLQRSVTQRWWRLWKGSRRQASQLGRWSVEFR